MASEGGGTRLEARTVRDGQFSGNARKKAGYWGGARRPVRRRPEKGGGMRGQPTMRWEELEVQIRVSAWFAMGIHGDVWRLIWGREVAAPASSRRGDWWNEAGQGAPLTR